MQLTFHERNEQGSMQKPAVVLLHGVFGRGRNLGQLARSLAPDFRVWAFDLRNHGDSPHGPVSYEAMAQDVLDTMTQLELERACVLGHSMGGKTAMAMALLAPERVERLVVADIAPAPVHFGQRRLAQTLAALKFPVLRDRQEVRAFLLAALRGMPGTASSDQASDPALADWLGQNLAFGPTAPARWTIGMNQIAEGFAQIEDWPQALNQRRWKGPALFLRGGRSPYVSPDSWPAVKALFPNAMLQTLPDAGHWLHVEQPEAFNDAVRHFLLGPDTSGGPTDSP
ncbi:alpha/beta fold hydrolase [Oecophyllibacter saccharovorans]|uniref:alpha/beta fold hydrolase n=1 Tax=Oecophyllibacter saccharovorans TaxID=2558360 RepID=UPI001E56C2D8|nr:alpha/beta fold hydrolase [Oecophyllibacter saccharovorans]